MSKKLTIDYIKRIKDLVFDYDGTRCISDESDYKSAHSKLKFICKNNHEYTMIWNNWYSRKHDGNCIECKLEEKLDHIKEYSMKNGSKCISEKYIKNNERLEFICNVCSNYYTKTWLHFYNRNQKCPICSLENRSGKKHKKWKDDRTRLIRSGFLRFSQKYKPRLYNDPLYNNFINDVETPTKYTVDHIQPRIAFIDNDLDKLYDLNIIKEICNNTDNIRIIPRTENGSKGGKYNQEEFMTWFNEKIKEYNTTNTNERSE